MKIVFLSFYSGLVNRGMETVVNELSLRLAVKNQVKVIHPNKNLKAKTIFSFTLKSLTKIHKFKPDIIFTTNGGWQSLIIKVYTLFNKSKLVISGQAGLGRPDKWNLLLKPDLSIALGQRNFSWAQKHSRQVNITTIPNGVDLKLFKPTGKKLKINLPGPIALCVAGPEKYKNVELTIKAMAKLKSGSLLLAGGGESQRLLGEKLLGKRFLMKKFTHEQMPQVYRSVDIFTLVSEPFEAFGIAYLEALASGLPIVAPLDELREEILGKYALYLDNLNNLTHYTAQLKKAFQQKKSYSEYWLNQFSWDNIADLYQQAFKDVIKN